MSSADVVVIGGGCIGASAAFHLTRLDGKPPAVLLKANAESWSQVHSVFKTRFENSVISFAWREPFTKLASVFFGVSLSNAFEVMEWRSVAALFGFGSI